MQLAVDNVATIMPCAVTCDVDGLLSLKFVRSLQAIMNCLTTVVVQKAEKVFGR